MFGLRRECISITVLTVLLVIPAHALAGGLTLYEIGTADVGLASAGWAHARRTRPRS